MGATFRITIKGKSTGQAGPCPTTIKKRGEISMLLHLESKAIFDDILLRDYYTLEGKNIEGKFRIPAAFDKDFEYIPDTANIKEIKPDKVKWSRALIYYIGQDRRNQRLKKAKLAEARKLVPTCSYIAEKVKIKGRVIQKLDLTHLVSKIEIFDWDKVLAPEVGFNISAKAMEERFAPVSYGRVLQYGVVVNTDYFYYIFENGVRVDLKKERANNEPSGPAKASVNTTNKNTKSKLSKASKEPLGHKKQETNAAFDLKYLEAELGLPATKIRAKLRKFYEKPDGGWKWSSKEEVDKVIKKIK